MGCLFSKNGQVRTLSDEVEEPLPASAFSTRGAANAWLQEIGLPQYAAAFEDAGFSDWDLLACLTEADLEAITAHTGTVIPPGHRKKLLMASRQMGQSSQQALAVVPPFGSARRYSHGSNPCNGNGSRVGGLAVTSLERRSYGRRPLSSSSRHPSLCNPANGHHQHHLYQGPRNATDDGMVSGRRSRAIGVMVPSRNSSRNSLSGVTGGGGGGGAMVGHTIGYIASPSVTGGDNITATSGLDRPFPRSVAAAGPGGLDGVADFWVPSEVRLSAVEPSSPRTPAAAAVAAAATAVAAGVVSTPQRRRRRWSMNKCASRGALISGGGAGAAASVAGRVVGSEVASGSSMGWIDAEAAAGGAGGPGSAVRTRVDSPDDVRQISMTSSVAPSEAVVLGGPVSPARRVSSRELQSLVVGAAGGDGTPLRNQTFRSPSLAARPDKPYSVMATPLPTSPQRSSAGLSSSITAVVPSIVALAAGPSGAMLATPHLLEPQPRPYHHQHAQPQQQPQQQQQQQQRIHSAKDGGPGLAGAFGANSNTAASASGGAFGRGTSAPVSSGRRPSTANNDSTLKYWGPARPESASPLPPPPAAAAAGANHARPRSGGAGGSGGAPSSTQPGVAWGSHGDAAGSTTVSRSQDALEGDDSPSGDGQGQGTPSSALPRFVRALAGWAMPAGGGGAAGSGGGGNASASRTANGNQKRLRSAEKAHQRASAPQVVAARAAGSGRSSAVQLASEMGAHRNAPPPQDAVVGRSVDTVNSSAKSARQQLAPDTSANVGVWDQDEALCIKGRGYKPTAATGVTAALDEADGGPGARPGSAASNGGGGGNSVAAAAAAARGGGWPFVMPQLPQPTRMSVSETPAPVRPAAAGPGVLAVFGVGIRGGKSGGGGGGARGSVGQAAISAPFGPSAVAADCPGASSSPSAGPTTVPAALPFAVHWGARGSAAAAAGDGSNPSTLLESMTSDWSARRAPPQHSSRPHDWKISGGGGNSDVGLDSRATDTTSAAATEADVSVEELAMYGCSPVRTRVQIVNSTMASSLRQVPYDPAGGGALSPLRGGAAAAAAAHWPAMPLQPPTRAKPAVVYGNSPATHGVGGAPMGAAVMELLAPEAPGPSRRPDPPPACDGGGGGSSAAAAATVQVPVGPSRPSPGRQLDLEMLADQVDRIMAHVSCITHDDHAGGRSEGGGGAADGQAGGGSSDPACCGGGGGGGAAAADGLKGSLRPGARMQAIDQKRQELQALHRDLVTRVAALAAQPAQPQQPHADQPPPPPPPPQQPRGGSADGGTAGEGDAAVDALLEVEARIRAKLAELAEMTIGPRRGDAAAGLGGAPAAAAAASAVRKRTMRSDDAATGAAAAGNAGGSSDGGGDGGTAGGRRRRDAEAALPGEVLAVLGARKRQVRGGRRSSNSDGGAESGAGGPPPEHFGAAARDVAAAGTSRVAAAAGGGGGGRVLDGGDRGGAVLAEMHDALRAELLAIDSKIKARVRAPGAAVARRV